MWNCLNYLFKHYNKHFKKHSKLSLRKQLDLEIEKKWHDLICFTL